MHTFILSLLLQCFLPLFSNDTEFTGLSVVNTDTQTRDVSITAVSMDTGSQATGRITIPPDGQRARLLNEIMWLLRTNY
jgi:hypothetical protein